MIKARTEARQQSTVAAKHRRAHDEDGGFILPWFALLLIVMVAMAGFGVDVWNWWYSGQKLQRAADAGALSGVVFLPANFNSTLPSAESTAFDAVNINGYSPAQTTVKVGARPNQLEVTITQTVANNFASLIGVNSTDITRTAVAEFNAPIKMGSPTADLGCDPEHGCSAKHWLNIGAPNVNQQTGDRYADLNNCSGSWGCAGNVNSEYIGTNYVYTVEFPNAVSNVDLQIYDPEYANGATNCDNQWISPADLGTLQGLAPYSSDPSFAARYGGGQGDFCTGDDGTNLGAPQPTAWIVRDSSVSPFQPLANPVVTGPVGSGPSGAASPCAHQFKGYNPDSGSYFFDLLNPGSGQYDDDFAKSFHQYYTMCHINSAPAGAKFFIQVRSNLKFVPGSQNDPSYLANGAQDLSIGGQNRYSVRVVNSGTSTIVAGANTYAETHLPIYSNTVGGQSPNFYLARLLPGGGASGRVLHLEFFDIGDVGGGTTTIAVTPPNDPGFAVFTPTCAWSANGGAMPASTIAGCTVSGITSNTYPSGFQGVLVRVDIKVPGNYTCDVVKPSGCWFRIQMSYTSGTQANDTTTWDATIGGDPVRLVK
jgi:Flp pilus assembly protein TadG